MSEAEYPYDVFVSYSHADQGWVRNELFPRLEQAGISYIDQLQFELGRPQLFEIERAIKHSHRTLLVLSPDYLASNWRQFDAILLNRYGLNTGEWRAIPAVIQQCQLPSRLGALTCVDLQDSGEETWQRLICALSLDGDMADVDCLAEEPSLGEKVSQMLRDPVWQGIVGVFGIVACVVAVLTIPPVQQAIWPAATSTLTPIIEPSPIRVPISYTTPETPTAAATATPTSTLTPSPTVTLTPTPPPTVTRTPAPTPTVTPTPSDMVRVPGGEFLMGSLEDYNGFPGLDRDPEPEPDEFPQRSVVLATFWIDRTEITNGAYRACVDAGVCPAQAGADPDYRNNPAFDNYPAVFIAWDDAKTYCRWAGKRLPTEAEWEKAARGEDGRIWPWGNALKDNLTAPVRRANVGDSDTQGPTQVGTYLNGASPYGTLDMSGNVWEWVNDWYSPTYYQDRPDPDTSPPGPSEDESDGRKVIRGGSFDTAGIDARTADRNAVLPGPYQNIGFRCARLE